MHFMDQSNEGFYLTKDFIEQRFYLTNKKN